MAVNGPILLTKAELVEEGLAKVADGPNPGGDQLFGLPQTGDARFKPLHALVLVSESHDGGFRGGEQRGQAVGHLQGLIFHCLEEGGLGGLGLVSVLDERGHDLTLLDLFIEQEHVEQDGQRDGPFER